jgi:DNA-binding MarR family transcriptional regulator
MAASKTIDRLESAIAALKKVQTADGRGLDLDHLHTLLFVATHEGTSQIDVAKQIGVNQSTMTRIVARLGEYETPHKRGLGLVSQEVDDTHRSRRLLYLTPQGRKIVTQVEALLN